jgi:predicted glycosyltransferase
VSVHLLREQSQFRRRLRRVLGAAPAPRARSEAPVPAVGGRPLRIVLYSHDTQGLGHMRRNLLIAKSLLTMEPRPNILLIGGAREMGSLAIPPGIDCITLPGLGKSSEGEYRPRSLSISLRRLIDLRASAIESTLQSFDPDLLIVDKVPLGAFDELEPGLRWLRARGKARVVLGLREVLDDPATTRREWRAAGNDAAIRSFFDTIWVYGDPAVYDPAVEYEFDPSVTAKLVYTGYLDRSFGLEPDDAAAARTGEQLSLRPEQRVALCCTGGGQDGFALASAFARAPFPEDTVGVIVTGPFMDVAQQKQLQQRAESAPWLRVLTFVEETAPLLRLADCVVAMGGYNTVCELLAFEKRALIVPRVAPRREQLIRAERLRDLGLLDLLHPDELAPSRIGAWLASASAERPAARSRVDLNALARLPRLVGQLCAHRHAEEKTNALHS